MGRVTALVFALALRGITARRSKPNKQAQFFPKMSVIIAQNLTFFCYLSTYRTRKMLLKFVCFLLYAPTEVENDSDTVLFGAIAPQSVQFT